MTDIRLKYLLIHLRECVRLREDLVADTYKGYTHKLFMGGKTLDETGRENLMQSGVKWL